METYVCRAGALSKNGNTFSVTTEGFYVVLDPL
jgi:hypothetical protein